MNGDRSAEARPEVGSVAADEVGLGPILDRTQDAVVVAEASTGRIVLWNHAAVRIFGYSKEEAVGLHVEDLVPEQLRAQHRAGLARYARSGKGSLIDSGDPIELPALCKDNSRVWIELSLTPLTPNRMPARYALAIIRDVTRRREAEARLNYANAILERTEALARLGSWEWNVASSERVFRWSKEMCRIHSIEETAQISIDRVRELIHDDDVDAWVAALTAAATTRTDMPGLAYRTASADGGVRWVWTEACYFADRPDVLVGFAQDITETKEITDELARLALFDELTGVRNRRGFLTAAEALIRLAQRDRQDVALLYIDVDNLKAINDRFGHDAGDRALANLSSLLQSTFRASDLVARMGGDEFVVLLRTPDVDNAVERLVRANDESTATPAVEFSIGAASQSAGEALPIEELIRRADAAMYRAKATKRGTP